jgi:ABC-type protease/lipase transport system fused ATPase/permease subunit
MGTLFNIVLGALTFLGGWLFTRVFSLLDNQDELLNKLNEKIFSDFITLRKEVESEGRKHQQEIADLALKISTTYVTKESFEAYFDRIEAKLDRNFETIQQHLINKNKN